ncbi:putative protein shisa-8 [Lingula anatina]|uniref:Shisa N-terminal domain-containing protein n=1 Tax=Lingula anatina TaxID=7574 RepID=A0A1S3IBZ8_LINAN|nr:putative protein shisa-8 [Lingula anatina]|eukprot:XP_013395767.1 putative protein shisa-8 [Lingula anatina]
MAGQFKAILTCLFTLLAIVHTVSGGEYCCPYFTSSGSHRRSFYCSEYCCGTSTGKFCCDSFFIRYSSSYPDSLFCPFATRPPTTTVPTVGSGEYCCAYYTSSGSYRSSFYCSPYCCGTSTSKYCCDRYYNRYYPSYSYSSFCPEAPRPPTTTVNSGEYCCAYFTTSGSYRDSFYCSKYCCGTSTSKYCCTSSYSRYYGSYSSILSCPTPSSSSTTSGIINVTGAIVGSVVGFIALCVIIGVVICCATGCCRQRRGTVTRPPGNGIVMLNTPPTTQGHPVGYGPPPPYPGYGPEIPPPQPPNTEFGPGISPPQPPNTGFGPGIPPPNNPFGQGSPPNADAPPLDAAKGAGDDAPPPPYPGTDNTYTALQR